MRLERKDSADYQPSGTQFHYWMQGTIVINEEDAEYGVEFCGYFPVDNPKYTMIVSINKGGLPASGGLMAGDVFRQIVEAY